MKTPKTLKSQLKRNDAVPKSADTSSNREVTLKTSFDDLRSPNSREVLRQHFQTHFSGPQRRSSEEWTNNDMGVKDRLSRTTSNQSVGMNSVAKSSSSSVDTPGQTNKRLSAVPESSTNTTIDIEQAIHLLQELKKTASPEELVALHKALLPTRDSMLASSQVNEERSSNTSLASMIRRKSMVPPGLATRGGASEDLLRKQEDVKQPVRSKTTQVDDWGRVKEKEPKSSLAALDLANEQAQSTQARAATPAEHEYVHPGAYRPGTLRITNGAASPEPSITYRKSVEITGPERLSYAKRASQDHYRTAPTTPEGRGSQEFHLARTGTSDNVIEDANVARDTLSRKSSDIPSSAERSSSDMPGRSRPRATSVSGIPVPEDRDESQPRMYKSQRPRRSRDPVVSESPRSRESSRSRLPLRVETRPSKQSLASLASKASKRHLGFSRESLEPLRPEVDDGRVSPVVDEMPRFAERWSHRASHLSQEYVSDGENSAGPYADKAALLQRLSTVYDGEGDEADGTAHETPAAALSKLNGIEEVRTAEQTVDMMLADTAPAPTPLAQSLNIHRYERPTAPQKKDSGYGTDNSTQDKSRKSSTEPIRMKILNIDEGISLEDDVQSLYSLNAILKTPGLLSSVVPSSPLTPPQASTSSKKRSSFLRLSTSGKGNSHKAPTSPVPPMFTDSIESSPVDLKAVKQKKLQKRMPEALRKERKAQRSKLKEDQLGDVGNFVLVSNGSEVMTNGSIARVSEPGEVSTPPTPSQSSLVPTELHGDSSTELNSDVTLTAHDEEHAALSVQVPRQRSKTVTKLRSSSTSQPTGENDAKVQRSWSVNRKRSKSMQRDGETTPKQPTFDLGPISCINPSTGDSKQTDDYAPLWTDHSSVSRSLGGSPYDISTTMFRRTVGVPSAVMHQIQSPHQITTLPRSKSGGMRGMDSDMASEFARMRSRDVAIQNNEEVYDRPRVATPKSRGEDKASGQSTPRLPSMSQDRPPNWQEKSSNEASPMSELPARPFSTYSESIPPLPEMPADVQRVVSKVNEIVAKRLLRKASKNNTPEERKMTAGYFAETPSNEHAQKDSVMPTPATSERSSDERPGDSTMTVAEAVRRAVESRRKQEARDWDELDKTARARPAGPRQQSQGSLQVQVQGILRTPSAETIRIGLGSDIAASETQEQDPANRDQHAKVWREHCRSIGESLAQQSAVEEEPSALETTEQAPGSPAIVISRYITPQGVKTKQRRASAAERADAYRQLIGEDKDNIKFSEDASRTTSVASTFNTDQSHEDRPRPHSPKSPKSLKSLYVAGAPAPRARSPGGRVITPSGNFHPYTPADAVRAEQSRAESLAKLTGSGSAPPSSRSLDIPRQSVLQSKGANESLFDRYSGGLSYGYQHGAGFVGSAGTRVKADVAQRKSKELSEGWGIDLSDVPVFLRPNVLRTLS